MPKSGCPALLVEIGFTVTVDDADFVWSAWLVAVTVTLVVEVLEGAVNRPVLVMVPAEAVQLTAVFVEPSTYAVNCWVLADDTVALVGVIDTETDAGALAWMVQDAAAVWLPLSCTVRVAV